MALVAQKDIVEHRKTTTFEKCNIIHFPASCHTRQPHGGAAGGGNHHGGRGGIERSHRRGRGKQKAFRNETLEWRKVIHSTYSC